MVRLPRATPDSGIAMVDGTLIFGFFSSFLSVLDKVIDAPHVHVLVFLSHNGYRVYSDVISKGS